MRHKTVITAKLSQPECLQMRAARMLFVDACNDILSLFDALKKVMLCSSILLLLLLLLSKLEVPSFQI